METDEDFVELNNFLSDKSYIFGYTLSYDDIIVAQHLENNTDPARLEEILKQQKFRYFSDINESEIDLINYSLHIYTKRFLLFLVT